MSDRITDLEATRERIEHTFILTGYRADAERVHSEHCVGCVIDAAFAELVEIARRRLPHPIARRYSQSARLAIDRRVTPAELAQAKEALRRIEHYHFDVMSDSNIELQAVKEIARAALASLRAVQTPVQEPT